MKINDKINQITTAWALFAPEKSYCNYTLVEATSAFQPVFTVRQELANADISYAALIARRDTVDAEVNDLMLRIVNAVRSEPDGENSELYRGMGYKTKNERGVPGPRNTMTNPLSSSPNGSQNIVTIGGENLVTMGGLSGNN